MTWVLTFSPAAWYCTLGIVPNDGRNLYMAGVAGVAGLLERELSRKEKGKKKRK